MTAPVRLTTQITSTSGIDLMGATRTLRIVGLAASYSKPSKTFALVDRICSEASREFGLAKVVFDMNDVGSSLGTAMQIDQLDAKARGVMRSVLEADVLVVGTPTFKGSYPGLFKHLIDLIPPTDLRGKVTLITATGGGDRHALMVEHQLRPLFAFFMAHTIPTAVYASDRDFSNYEIISTPLLLRIADAMTDLATLMPPGGSREIGTTPGSRR